MVNRELLFTQAQHWITRCTTYLTEGRKKT